MQTISSTTIRLKDIALHHFHLVGKHASIEHEHAHTGDMSLKFLSPKHISFYVSPESVQALHDSVSQFLSVPTQEMLEDRIRTLHQHVNDNVLPELRAQFKHTANDNFLEEINFVTISDGEMGHTEKGEPIECGSKAIYKPPSTLSKIKNGIFSALHI